MILLVFLVKELGTRNILLLSNSTGNLYPFHSTHGATILFSPHSAFLSSSIWHSRLGHPRNDILHSLYSSNSIQCNKTPSFGCHSCPLGKHVRLSFVNSQFVKLNLLILFIVMNGLLPFQALRDTNTMSSFLIIIQIFMDFSVISQVSSV